ncbi:imidazolonepropionase [Rudaea sp.]|uniref:imidazolonepropionase n=1 Tax=Rudaea sp. TaxID=2136325 RepID=UPI002ED1BCDB
MTTRWDDLLLDCRLATLAANGAAFGLIDAAALAWEDGRIVFAAPMSALPGKPNALAREVASARGALVTPGLVDCHTHLVFAGDRAAEFDLRLNGASYADIAKAGGGIVSTVTKTRAASEDELLAQSLPRARALLADGVTTLEIKSGYGLDLDSETKMLRVARRIGDELGITVRTTFLGAHAVPPEFAGRQSDYVDEVCIHMLPQIAQTGLADAIDAFCENIAFTPSETRRVFETARAHGLPVKLHADQLSDQGAAALAAEFGALSADHLEYTNEAGIAAMAAAGSVAVMLPGAFYTLRESTLPPIETFRRHGVALAVASDLNPGTSPLLSLRHAMNMACTLFRMTPEETLRGATVHAARALGLSDRGTLAPGQRADFVIWDAGHPAELCYWIGGALAQQVFVAGRRVTGGVAHDAQLRNKQNPA